jgi:hypothetical protein
MAADTATVPFPSDYIIEHILMLSKYLIKLSDDSNLFGKPGQDSYSASLRTFYDRLQNKKIGPTTLPPGFLSEERIHARIYFRTDEDAIDRSLADYEDLYYALVARMQEMHHLLNLRIDSGFNVASHVVFEGGPSIADLHQSMSEYWDVLNNPAFGKALDVAIREAKVQTMKDEIVWQVKNDYLSHEDAQLQWAQLHNPEVYNSIVGLNFVQDWAPTMIGAYLELKYRHMLDLERDEATFKAIQERRQAKMKNLHRRTTLTGASEVDSQSETRSVRGIRKEAREVSKHTRAGARRRSREQLRRSSILHQEQGMQLAAENQGQAQMQSPPQNKAELHAGHDPAIEQQRAHQDQIHNTLHWQMKTQRVSEYSTYLRARASQDARHVVHGTRGSVANSSTGSSLVPVLTEQGGEIGYAINDVDLSGYMEF